MILSCCAGLTLMNLRHLVQQPGQTLADLFVAQALVCASCPDLQREHTDLASVIATCELRQLGWLACQAIQEHSRLLEAMNQPL